MDTPDQQLFPLVNFLRRLRHASIEARRAFIKGYERLLFPWLGTSTAQTKWWTYRNVTRVTIWGLDHFKNNVRLFMAMEALDLGPKYYCVPRNFSPVFSNRLFLLLMFLPHQKIYVYPYYGPPFGGIFDRIVRLSQIGAGIYCHCNPREEMPLYCPACHDCFCDHAMDGLEEV